jgi:hypothetical protein
MQLNLHAFGITINAGNATTRIACLGGLIPAYKA